MKKLLIFGAGGLAREIAFLVCDINRAAGEPMWQLLGFLDDDSTSHGSVMNGYEVLGGMEVLDRLAGEIYMVIAIGDPLAKKAVVERVRHENVRWATLIHPTVITSGSHTVGEGTVIFAGSILSTNTTVGRHVYLNFYSVIAHDAVVSDYVSIMTNSVISGRVVLGECAYLGTSVTTKQQVTIGKRAILGAGAVAIDDIPDDCTAVGVPAKPIKFHHHD